MSKIAGQFFVVVLSIGLVVGCGDHGGSPNLKKGKRGAGEAQGTPAALETVEQLKTLQKGLATEAPIQKTVEEIDKTQSSMTGSSLADPNLEVEVGEYKLTQIISSLKSYKKVEGSGDALDVSFLFGVDGIVETLKEVSRTEEAPESDEGTEDSTVSPAQIVLDHLTLGEPKSLVYSVEIEKINLTAEKAFIPSGIKLTDENKVDAIRGGDYEFSLANKTPSHQFSVVEEVKEKELVKYLLEKGFIGGEIVANALSLTINKLTPYQFVLILEINNSVANQKETLTLTYLKNGSGKQNQDYLDKLIKETERTAVEKAKEAKAKKADKARTGRRTKPKTRK